MIVRFIGTVAEIRGVVEFLYFGQAAELPDGLYREAVIGSCGLLPEGDFKAIGFNEQELKAYANPGPRQSAPQDFKAKFEAAKIKLHANRDALENPGMPVPTTPFDKK